MSKYLHIYQSKSGSGSSRLSLDLDDRAYGHLHLLSFLRDFLNEELQCFHIITLLLARVLQNVLL